MSSPLPPEILDIIVDNLHDEPTTLKSCCLVCKLWVPRTRKHLFAHVEFDAADFHVERWKKTFPDPSNSPAHHTRTLSIRGIPIATPAYVGMDDWIRSFRNVVDLCLEHQDLVSIVPFYGISPTVRSLCLTYTTPEIFRSFPHLEDLAFVDSHPKADLDGWTAPLTSPKLTGSLRLRLSVSARPVIRRLLELPDGPHFSKITVISFNEDAESVTDLVSKCSDTLETLALAYLPPGTVLLHDLSKAIKLKHLKFLPATSTVQWITMALQTVKSKHLQHITIRQYTLLQEVTQEVVYQEWQDLDHLLVKFWASHSIRPEFTYLEGKEGKDQRDYVQRLLPELTRRGLVDLVEVASADMGC